MIEIFKSVRIPVEGAIAMKQYFNYVKSAFRACFVLAACLFSNGFSNTSGETLPLTFAQNGSTQYVILMPPGKNEIAQFAASELASYLKQSTGSDFLVKDEPARADRKEIRLEQKTDDASVPENPQGYRIFTEGDDLVIRARSAHGILYGVYALLENKLGYRWFSPDETLVPKHDVLSIPAFDMTESPCFSYRELYAVDVFHHRLWAQRLRLNSGIFRWPDKPSDHLYNYLPYYSCHTFARLVPPDKYFESHPEYYGLQNGQRDKALLCLSNPDTFKVALETLKADLAKYKERPWIVSISQNDCGGWCQCPECQKIISEEKGETGLLIRFLNKFDDALKGENISIHTLAYTDTDSPPEKTKPNPGIIIQFCPIAICYGHLPGQCSNSEKNGNIAVEKRLKRWSEIHDNIWIWSYHVNFAHSFQPFPNIHTLAPYMRYFAEHKAKGVFAQSDASRATVSLYRLRNYVISKLLWNPNANDKQLVAEFVENYYKEGAPFIREYLDLLEKTICNNPDIHTGIFNTPQQAPYLTNKFIEESEAVFTRGIEACKDKPLVLHRLKGEFLSIQYMILVRWFDNQMPRPVEEISRILQEFESGYKAHNITGISEHDHRNKQGEQFLANVREKIAKESKS